jgi:hypothetical protein
LLIPLPLRGFEVFEAFEVAHVVGVVEEAAHSEPRTRAPHVCLHRVLGTLHHRGDIADWEVGEVAEDHGLALRSRERGHGGAHRERVGGVGRDQLTGTWNRAPTNSRPGGLASTARLREVEGDPVSPRRGRIRLAHLLPSSTHADQRLLCEVLGHIAAADVQAHRTHEARPLGATERREIRVLLHSGKTHERPPNVSPRILHTGLDVLARR